MRIGFLGLGIMGSRMAARLLGAGFTVTVWNRDRSKIEALMARGAQSGPTPREVVAACDVTFAMVSDPPASRALCTGPDGILEGVGPGHDYVEMSTVDPDTVRETERLVTARGARFLEAPVSGTKKPAEDGTLVVLAAGDRALYDDCVPAFQAMSKASHFLGPAGQAAKMKLVVNLILGTMTEVLGEALALGARGGLATADILAVLAEGAMASPLFASKGPLMAADQAPTSFPLKHQLKDLTLALAMGRDLGQELPVTAAVQGVFAQAHAQGLGDQDIAAVARVLHKS